MQYSNIKRRFLERRQSLQAVYSNERTQDKIDEDLLMELPEEAKNEGFDENGTVEVIENIVEENPPLQPPYNRVRASIFERIKQLFKGLDKTIFE